MNNKSYDVDLEMELENLIIQDYDKLYACAFRMVENHQDAEDVLQNSFLNAYKNLSKFRSEAKLFTWLYRIVINECYKYFKYINKLPLVKITEDLGVTEKEFFDSIGYNADFDDDLVIDELREKCLQAFLKCLPKNQRVCFLLKTCTGLKNKEIAEIMEMSVENVKVTLFRGRKQLQELFEMRCSLIDPQKPCQCQLWIKFMNDHNLALPTGYKQLKTDGLRKAHFKNLSLLKKIDYLYTVEQTADKKELSDKIKKIAANIM
ncbi:RNA polymerase sigma factor [Acetobacterium woodii]|uniref:RNA polymerase sigma factor n=1 Tax=Acetobacterium woodii (strain ATCC 29683 / DSM 1030 / JCM 2381 / KCTC 1655 / WB1) TaxID=931626 RepID=H6LJF6_ACEWD|nr:RNA polymerase sigma factor [Acetobacterium woodii]AFA49884.1 putative RNA polymerase sigma subunit, ECF family [Acetobacterium woodii DSM 1030]